jgi:hypothetical protein
MSCGKPNPNTKDQWKDIVKAAAKETARREFDRIKRRANNERKSTN